MQHKPMAERRAALQPHYRKSHERDRLSAIMGATFAVGVLMGVTITLAWFDLTGGA